ncbi:hypothetical protein METSCH_D08130 [Metschnikowia aff. pulcherrima]|uniref:LAA1-like C-terminal TPR repeats domain-containing protein n=1 Tax=Metschnikowia aff. pulcherrima TaxID=2163413 RepID=A0A4P6XUJ2_9ASCO|nr:hypothetical protein METSCH_D08130 [Metschnikowia aff. pulcherrima]
MMSLDTTSSKETYTNENTLTYLAGLDLRLAGHVNEDVAIDYASILSELDAILKQMLHLEKEKTAKNTKLKDTSAETSEMSLKEDMVSLNVVKMLSKNLSSVLEKLPSKVYDLANTLLGEIVTDDDGRLTLSGKIACVVLTDIFDLYPLQVASLIGFATTQLYKIVKKAPFENSDVVFLLAVVIKGALKSDIDEKFLAKLVKLALKTITQHSILVGGSVDAFLSNSAAGPSIVLVTHYIHVLENLFILQVTSNYQSLLEVSASSTSSSKMKPETLMAQQHLFQQAILSSHEKLFEFALLSQFPEVRNAMVHLLANLLINFVSTGHFDAYKYLLELYPMPALNLWDDQLLHRIDADGEIVSERRSEKNLLTTHDSEAIISSNLTTLLLQIGVVEAFVCYIQLELLQNNDFLASSLTNILDSILLKFDDVGDLAHIQNGPWVRTLSQWSKVVEFLVKECGSLSHDTLARYVMQHFSSSNEKTSRAGSPGSRNLSKEKKRESILFGFKGLKKSKRKGLEHGQVNFYTNAYQLELALRMMSVLFPYGVDFNSLMQSKSTEDMLEEAAAGDDGALVDEDENKTTTKRHSYVSDLLISLLANDSDYIRNYSLVCLLEYADVNRSESNRLSLEIFYLVSQEFSAHNSKELVSASTDRNVTNSGTTRLLSYSLALLAILKQADFTLLQNSTIAKLLSFCTQNLKHTTSVGLKSIKNGACWIILSALVTFYQESEFVKLNSSQFLVFWKNLLTSQFIGAGLSSDPGFGELGDVIQNLKLRCFSLLCLLNYISTVEVTPELLKQLQFLLIKSHKYLLHLESNFESIGSVTGFNPQAFNESDYNPNLINNLLLSNHLENSHIPAENQLVSLILYNKKIVMQGFIKIAHSLKGDINSSLVILLVKIFADPKLFSRLMPSEIGKEKTKPAKGSKQTAIRIVHQDRDLLFLGEEYNYNFGLTSKFESHTANLDELCCKSDGRSPSLSSAYPAAPFENEPMDYSGALVENRVTPEFSDWTASLERLQNCAVCHSVNFDPAMLISHRYSLQHTSSANLITSLVDLSVELFQLIFPTLSYKIQFSLLEQLRSSLSSKHVDPLRRVALTINATVALHGLLNHLVKSNTHLNEDLAMLTIEIFDMIETTNLALTTLVADLVGLATSLLPKTKLEEVVATTIAKIVSDTSPFNRGRWVLSLAKVNHYSHLAFLDIHDVIIQLTKDTHPVMAYYSLNAAAVLFETPLGNQSLIEQAVKLTYYRAVSNYFDSTNVTAAYENLRSRYGIAHQAATLLKVCVTSLGPRIKASSVEFKNKLFQALLLFNNGIGGSEMGDVLASIHNVLDACLELVIFEPALVEGFIDWFSRNCFNIIRANLKLGVGVLRPTFVNMEAIFPYTTSRHLLKNALVSLTELTKIGTPTLGKESLSLAWTFMELAPCIEVATLIEYWVDFDTNARWFQQLSQLFNMSSRKLVGDFIEVNYQQKLLPLQQRQKKVKKESNLMFADEEAQIIVGENDESDDKNQPINWYFRLHIYDLLTKLLKNSRHEPRFKLSLESKIQDIVRISFLGTTSPIVSVKLKGVDLLKNALEIFGDLEDPLYPGSSILEQQQAQIISALIPCFSSDSDASVMVEAIDVSSRFINLPRINFYSKQRILKTMIYLLEEISSGKFLKFVHLESMAEYGRKSIQLAILNCWAVLTVKVKESAESIEQEFEDIAQKYSKLLISLWIIVLKDLSNLKYNQPNSKEIRLYDEYWLNFVGVLSLVLEKDPASIKDFLQEEEDNFFFVMFCQCSEALIRNQDVSQVLTSVNRLVKIQGLAQILFDDGMFEEVIDLMDRLILMEADMRIKCKVVDTVHVLFDSYSKFADTAHNPVDKFYELLRVVMLPLFETFPFLRHDFDTENAMSKVLLARSHTEDSLIVAKKLFLVLSQMIQGCPESTREDLASCMLYVVAKIIEHGDDVLISAVLPFLKNVVLQIAGTETELLGSFVKIVRGYNGSDSNAGKRNRMIMWMILVTGGDVNLSEEEARGLSLALIEGLSDRDLASTSIQSIKSIISNAKGYNSTCATIAKNVLRSILDYLLEDRDKTELEIKVKMEIAFLFLQSPLVDTEDKSAALLALFIPLLIDYDDKELLSRSYLHEKMTSLMNSRSNSFKQVVREQLNDNQRSSTERLVKYQDERSVHNGGEEVFLKSFA